MKPPCEEHSKAIEKLTTQNDFYVQGLSELKNSIDKLDIKIEKMSIMYVARNEYAEFKIYANERIERIEKNLSRATWVVLSGVIIAVMSVILANPSG